MLKYIQTNILFRIFMKKLNFILLVLFLPFCYTTIAQSIETKCSKYENPLALSDVKYWAYQIQAIESQGAVDSLIASHYDMLVLEPTRTDWSSDAKNFNTSEMVTRLKNSYASDGIHRKLVVAYIDIGEAEDWRWYWNWSSDWNCQPPIPSDWPNYIIACDPDGWRGNYPLKYWNPNWKDIVIWGNNQNSNTYRNYTSIIDEVILDGFDGIYLDWVEAFENEDVMNSAKNEGKDPAVEMITFIKEMRTYALTRNSNFLIIQQNAASLCNEHPELFGVIDAIAQEAIWYDGDATDNWNNTLGHDFINEQSLVKYYTDYLDQYLNAGVPVFSCEYALGFADSAYAKSHDKGYIPYSTRRSLGKLTTTPPPDYLTVDISVNSNNELPDSYGLSQNYPNPFNPSTNISFTIPTDGVVKLNIYNLLGEVVSELIYDNLQAGTHQYQFNASNLTNGIYFYSISVNGFKKVKKMLLLK